MTLHDIILPFSIHSAIHEGIDGDFKITSFLRVIKSNAKGKITILFCEAAHQHVLSLKYMGDLNVALSKCRNDAIVLLDRFKDEMKGCEVLFWEDFVNRNIFYNKFKNVVMDLLESDEMMRSLLNDEVGKTYTTARACEYPDKLAYFNKATLDLVEMIIAVKIIYENSHKILIYPGNMPRVFSHLKSILFPEMIFVNAGIKQKEIANSRL